MKIVSDPRKFKITTLDRLIESSSFAPFMGISFNEFGQFKAKTDQNEFHRAYKRIVSDIAHDKIDSRKINSDKEIKTYLNSLGKDRPNLGNTGDFSSGDLVPDSMLAGEDEPSHHGTKAKGSRRNKALVPSHVKCYVSSPRIESMLGELKRLKVADYPNSCGVTFRVLFELLVAHRLDITGKIKPMLAAQQLKGKTEEWYPTFRQTLTSLLDDKQSGLELNPQARKFFKQMATDKHHLLTIDRLDQFVHNKFGTPTESQLRDFWAASKDLIVQLLVDPAEPILEESK